MDKIPSPVAIIVRDSLIGRALEQLLRLLLKGPVAVLRVRWEDAKSVPQFVAKHGPAVVFLDLAPFEPARTPAGLVILRIGQAGKTACEAIAAARPLQKDEMRHALAFFFKVEDRIRTHLHDRANDLKHAFTSGDLTVLQVGISRFARDLEVFDMVDEASVAKRMVDLVAAQSLPKEERLRQIRSLLVEMQQRHFPLAEQEIVDRLLPNEPPPGYETILAADDDGYAPEWQECLEDLGYGVHTVTSLQDARSMLLADPGRVFICDLHWREGRPEDVRNALALARRTGKCKLILAVSAALLRPGEVPEADAVLGGAEAKLGAGARRIHGIIWTWAEKTTQQARKNYGGK